MATKKVEETPAVSASDIDDLKTQIASIQNLAEVTHAALDALTTRVAAIEDKTSDGSETTDEDKFIIMWEYIQRLNSLINKGGLGNQIDGAADEALQAVSEQSEKAHVKGVALGVKAKVLSGHTLAESLNDFRKIFPAVYRATVAAGEQSGRLDTILDRLAEYTESRHSLRQKVNHALIYPVVLTGLSLTIIVLMLVYVVPKVVGVFQTSGQSLPILTRSLIWFSDFLQNWWLGILGVLGILIFTIHRSLENEETKKRAHRWILKIPVLGKVSRGLNTARFTRTFSILNSSGVPVLESLRISASVVSNLPMRDAVEKATMRVREGSAIGHALNESGIFPAMSIHLISSGETSGELDGMLEKAATHQEKEMDSTLTTMLNLLEPILIIFMGLIVLAIVMAVLLPIFQINQLIL